VELAEEAEDDEVEEVVRGVLEVDCVEETEVVGCCEVETVEEDEEDDELWVL
jgi:hypothetical protein